MEIESPSKPVAVPKKRKPAAPKVPGDGPAKSKRVRTKRIIGDDVALSDEQAAERVANADTFLTQLTGALGAFSAATDTSARCRSLAALIEGVAMHRAFMYTPMDAFAASVPALVATFGEDTDWMHVLRQGAADAPLMAECLARYRDAIDADFARVIDAATPDGDTDRLVMRPIVALVDLTASSSALDSKRALFNADAEPSVEDDIDAMDLAAVSSLEALVHALGALMLGAGGKEKPLTPGQRRRIRDFYALSALHGCLHQMHNAALWAEKHKSDMSVASRAIDRATLMYAVQNMKSGAALSTLDWAKTLDVGTHGGLAPYVPAALWHWRGASLAGLARAIAHHGLEKELPLDELTTRFDKKTKSDVPIPREQWGETFVSLTALALESDDDKSVWLSPLQVDHAFAWPAVETAQGLTALSVKNSARVRAVSLPLSGTVFHRDRIGTVTLERAPYSALPAPWAHVYTTGSVRMAPLYNVQHLHVAAPLGAFPSLRIASKKLKEVTLERLFEAWADLSERDKARWGQATLVIDMTPELTGAAWKPSDTLVKLQVRMDGDSLALHGDRLRNMLRSTLALYSNRQPKQYKIAGAEPLFETPVPDAVPLSVENFIDALIVLEAPVVPDAKIKEEQEEEEEEEEDEKGEKKKEGGPKRAPAEKITRVDGLAFMPTLSVPTFNYHKDLDAEKQEKHPMNAFARRLWQRRTREFADTNRGWFDMQYVPSDPDNIYRAASDDTAQDVAAVRRDLGLADTHAPGELPRWASAMYVGKALTGLEEDEDGLRDLKWLRYYRLLNQLASIMLNTDTLKLYDIEKGNLTGPVAAAKKLPYTIPAQGLVLWSSWHTDVRVRKMDSSMTNDLFPMPFQKSHASDPSRIVFYYKDKPDVLVARNWLSDIAARAPLANAQERVPVTLDDLPGLYGLYIALPASIQRDVAPMTSFMRGEYKETHAIYAESYAKTVTEQRDTLLRKLRRDEQTRQSDIDAVIKEYAKMLKNPPPFTLMHENFPVFSLPQMLPVLVLTKKHMAAVDGKLTLGYSSDDQQMWTLYYADRLIGTTVPVPLMEIRRVAADPAAYVVACPMESVMTCLGASCARTLFVQAHPGTADARADTAIHGSSFVAKLLGALQLKEAEVDKTMLASLRKKLNVFSDDSRVNELYSMPAKNLLYMIHTAFAAAYAIKIKLAGKSSKVLTAKAEALRNEIRKNMGEEITRGEADEAMGHIFTATQSVFDMLASENPMITDATLVEAPDVWMPDNNDHVTHLDQFEKHEQAVLDAVTSINYMPWAYVRNELAGVFISALALMHLGHISDPARAAMHAAATDEAHVEMIFASATRKHLEDEALGGLFKFTGPTDFIDLSFDYSPLAYRTLEPTQLIFGDDVASGNALYGKIAAAAAASVPIPDQGDDSTRPTKNFDALLAKLNTFMGTLHRQIGTLSREDSRTGPDARDPSQLAVTVTVARGALDLFQQLAAYLLDGSADMTTAWTDIDKETAKTHEYNITRYSLELVDNLSTDKARTHISGAVKLARDLTELLVGKLSAFVDRVGSERVASDMKTFVVEYREKKKRAEEASDDDDDDIDRDLYDEDDDASSSGEDSGAVEEDLADVQKVSTEKEDTIILARQTLEEGLLTAAANGDYAKMRTSVSDAISKHLDTSLRVANETLAINDANAYVNAPVNPRARRIQVTAQSPKKQDAEPLLDLDDLDLDDDE